MIAEAVFHQFDVAEEAIRNLGIQDNVLAVEINTKVTVQVSFEQFRKTFAGATVEKRGDHYSYETNGVRFVGVSNANLLAPIELLVI